MNKTVFAAALSALTASAGLLCAAPAGADAADPQPSGQHVLGIAAHVGDSTWTVSNLKPSSDVLSYHPAGTLWEATASDEASHGSTTPIVSNFNARARSGQTYRELFGVASAQGVNPAGLAQGQTVTGKLYFDVTGDSPDSVTYNAGGPDLALWVQPPPSSGSTGSGGHAATSVGLPAAGPTSTTPSTTRPAGNPGGGSAGTVIPGATPGPQSAAAGTPAATPAAGAPAAGAPAPGAVQPNPAPTADGQGAPTGSDAPGSAGAAGTPAPAAAGTPAPAAAGAPTPAAVTPAPNPAAAGSQGTPLQPDTQQVPAAPAAPAASQPATAPAAITQPPASPSPTS